MAQTSSSKCSLCGVNNGIYFCYECRKALCKQCKTPHDNIPVSKNHTVKDLKSVDLTAFQSISNCKAHNADFSLYCTQCKAMICGKCVTTIHKRHDFSDIDQIADEMRKEAEIQVEEIQEKMTKSSMIIGNIEDTYLPEIKNQAKCISNEIKLAVQDVQQVIDANCNVKITEVEDFEILENDKLNHDFANRKQVHFRCSDLCSTLEQLLNEKHAITFLNAYMNLKDDFKDFQEIDIDSIEIKRPPHFDKTLFMEELIRKLITKFNIRLSGIYGDTGDKNIPQKLGERFAAMYLETWPSAYESLKPKDIDDDENDEGTMDTLQQIVKVIYDFSKKVSQEQIDRLIEQMIPPVINPVYSGTDLIKPPSEQMRTKTEQMAREYRKIVAPASVKVLQKEIFDNHIKGHKLQEPVSKELVAYVEQCIDLIWYMCIQQPPMEIRWAVKGEKFIKEQFRFSGRKGKKYRMTVWPAVFLHKEGPLVAPGYAVPDK